MRGIPSQFVPCQECGSEQGWPNTRRCSRCSGRRYRLRYVWNEEKDRIVREAWQSGRTKPLLTEAITDAVRRIGCPRHIIRFRAALLGLTQDTRRPWTAAEIAFVEESSGERSARWIAQRLGRSKESVMSFMDARHLTRRVLRGYTLHEVKDLMGVSFPTVQRWLKQGLLRTEEDRVTEGSLKKLVLRHPEMYTLRKVNESWFKALVFGDAKVYRGPNSKENHEERLPATAVSLPQGGREREQGCA